MNSIKPIVEECERVIAEAIAHFGLTVKSSQIVVTVQSKGIHSAYGWFATNRWQNGQVMPIHEINLSAEYLKENDALKTLLHELAHAENFALGIKDVSGARHNLKFKAMAQRLGLDVTATPHGTVGFSHCTLGDGAKAFEAKMTFKRELFVLTRVDDTGRQTNGKGSTPATAKTVQGQQKQNTRMLKVVCPDCGYTVRTTAKWIEVGLPTCPCGTEMETE